MRPIGGRCGSGRLHDLGDHQLARPRIGGGVRRDQDVALDAAVVGDHVADAGLHRVAADQAVEAALQHLDDRALAPAAPVDAGDAGQHAVAVHRLAHLERRQEQVVALAGARVGTQEAEAVGVRDHHAGDQVHALGRHEAAAPVLQQLAVADHRAEALGQRVEAVGFGQRQLLRQRIGGHRPVVGGDDLQQHFAAGDGLFVAGCFARGVGVAGRRARRRRRLARRGAHGPGQARVRQPAGQLAAGFAGLPATARACFDAAFLRAGLAWGAGLARGLGAAAGAALAGSLGHSAMVRAARAGAVATAP
jgi:hypothetical protein